MENKAKLRCPMGVPGAIIAALIALVGIVYYIINFCWIGLTTSVALLLIAMPMARAFMMIHSANDRLDELERKLSEK
jgi:hypothetical protein